MLVVNLLTLASLPRYSAAGRVISESPIFTLRGAAREASLDFFERVDDQIMGGISQSALIASADGCACFTGIVRTDGGGFCGTRTRLFSTPLSLGAYSGIYLRARGDGKRYKMNVRTNEVVGELVYQAAFLPPVSTGFTTIRIPFSAFRLVKRSQPVPDGPPLDAKRIFQLGFVLSRFGFGEEDYNDAFGAGPFRLDLEEIGAYRDPLDFEASVDEAAPAGVVRAPGPALSSTLALWPEGKAPKAGGLKARVLRFIFRRFRKSLSRRVATRRSARAAALWAMRKEGKTLSQIRRSETAGGGGKGEGEGRSKGNTAK